MIVYLNGDYLPLEQAHVHVMDRGFLLGDGVYEVIPVYNQKPFRLEEHLKRFERSLRAIRLPGAIDYAFWHGLCQGLLQRNPYHKEQFIYIQITRGNAMIREHTFPEVETVPTVFAYIKPFQAPLLEDPAVSAITLSDIRWKRCDIKAITLLANALLRQEAKDKGAVEAILINNGYAIEGTASNFFMVKDGIIITPPTNHQMLGGITRELILELAKEKGLPYEERPIAGAELLTADEIWLTSSTREVQPVTCLDEQPVGNGQPGPVWQQMIQLYQDYKASLMNEG